MPIAVAKLTLRAGAVLPSQLAVPVATGDIPIDDTLMWKDASMGIRVDPFKIIPGESEDPRQPEILDYCECSRDNEDRNHLTLDRHANP
jgi:hypothetical protein